MIISISHLTCTDFFSICKFFENKHFDESLCALMEKLKIKFTDDIEKMFKDNLRIAVNVFSLYFILFYFMRFIRFYGIFS